MFSTGMDSILIGRFFGAVPLGLYTRASVLLARPIIGDYANQRGADPCSLPVAIRSTTLSVQLYAGLRGVSSHCFLVFRHVLCAGEAAGSGDSGLEMDGRDSDVRRFCLVGGLLAAGRDLRLDL